MGLLDYFFDEVFDTFWLPSCELLNKLLIQEIDVNFFCHGSQIVPFLSFWTATNSKNSWLNFQPRFLLAVPSARPGCRMLLVLFHLLHQNCLG